MNEWQSRIRKGAIETANAIANSVCQTVELPSGWSVVEGCGSWLLRHPNGYTTLFWDQEYSDFLKCLKSGIHDEFAATIKDHKKRIQAKEELEFIDERLKLL